jgi:hypothetical protein
VITDRHHGRCRLVTEDSPGSVGNRYLGRLGDLQLQSKRPDVKWDVRRPGNGLIGVKAVLAKIDTIAAV